MADEEEELNGAWEERTSHDGGTVFVYSFGSKEVEAEDEGKDEAEVV